MTVTCKSCGADILWALTDDGKKAPLDAKPTGKVIVLDGFVYADQGELLPPTAKVVDGYVSHFSTCPNAAEHRKAKP